MLDTEQVNSTAIGFAVASFYVLDFALNGLQASLRNLLLDIAPPGQLNDGNAWHGRMTNAGNIVGFGFGEDIRLPKGLDLMSFQDSSLWPNFQSFVYWVEINSASFVSSA